MWIHFPQAPCWLQHPVVVRMGLIHFLARLHERTLNQALVSLYTVKLQLSENTFVTTSSSDVGCESSRDTASSWWTRFPTCSCVRLDRKCSSSSANLSSSSNSSSKHDSMNASSHSSSIHYTHAQTPTDIFAGHRWSRHTHRQTYRQTHTDIKGCQQRCWTQLKLNITKEKLKSYSLVNT